MNGLSHFISPAQNGSKKNCKISDLAGGSLFANSALFPATYGGGIRSEFYLSSDHESKAWLLSPGVDGYYIPANPSNNGQPQDLGQAVGQAITTALIEVPTRVMLVSPNVDLNYLHQFSPHFCFVAGLRLGVAVGINGTNIDNENQAGKMTPDAGLYIGTRF